MSAAFAAFVLVGCTPAAEAVPSPSVSTSRAPLVSSTPATPAATAALRACAEEDIVAEFEGWGAAAGSIGGTFRLSPTSSDCALPSRPVMRVVDDQGATILAFDSTDPSGSAVPVRDATGKDATFVFLQWSNHGAESAYVCGRRTPEIAGLEIDLPSSRIVLRLPATARPTFCADPPERVFVEVIAR